MVHDCWISCLATNRISLLWWCSFSFMPFTPILPPAMDGDSDFGKEPLPIPATSQQCTYFTILRFGLVIFFLTLQRSCECTSVENPFCHLLQRDWQSSEKNETCTDRSPVAANNSPGASGCLRHSKEPSCQMRPLRPLFTGWLSHLTFQSNDTGQFERDRDNFDAARSVIFAQ